MDTQFDIESVTKHAEYTTSFSSLSTTISPEYIQAHSKLYGYPIFEITCALSTEKFGYGILLSDWENVFKCDGDDMKRAYIHGDTCQHLYVMLSKQNFAFLKDTKPTSFETYVAQRILFPDNQEIKDRPTKKIEFEVGFQLVQNLSDLLVFKHQKNILNYQADFLLELKNNFNSDIPSIVVEVNEDAHVTYTPENEKFRQSVVESFNNRMINIPIKRSATQKEIEKTAETFSKVIRDLAKELVIEYTLTDDFIRVMEENNIEKTFIKMFFDNKTGDPKFRYYMSDVGDFLGYSSDRNHETLRRKLKTSQFEEDIDWKVQVSADSEDKPKWYTKKTKEPNKNAHNGKEPGIGGLGGLNKKVIIMTRPCFNKLCVLSRKPRSVQVAMMIIKQTDVALDYAQRLQVKAITNISNIKENKEDAKKRVEELVKQRVSKTNEAKLEKDIKELHKSLESKTVKILELETTVEERDNSLRIVRENVDKANYQVSVVEEEKRKVKKELLKAFEELKIMKDSSISVEIYEKKQKEIEDLNIVFNEYKSKYNILIKKYNCVVKKYNDIVLKNKCEDEENARLLQSKDQEISLLSQENSLLLARIAELEKMKTCTIKPINVETKISLPVKPVVKPVNIETQISSPAKVVVKPVVKSTVKQVIKPIDVKLTKVQLSAKTINALKDICRDKSLVGFSSHKTKSALIDWMLSKL